MVICYNKNGIIYKGMIVPSRFQKKLQADALISYHGPGLDTHVVRRDYFFYFFYCFYRFFFFDFRITIYVTNNKGRNESLIIGEQPDIEGNQRISEKKKKWQSLNACSGCASSFPLEGFCSTR